MEQKILSLKDDRINSEVELFEYPVELRGGRNLAIGTSDEWIDYKWTNSWFGASICTVKAIGGQSYTVIVETEFVTLGNWSYQILFYWYDESNSIAKGTRIITIDEGDSFVTAQAPNDAGYLRVIFRATNSTDLKHIKYRKLKLKKGSSNGDVWTPAPEDLNLSYPDFITEFKPSISDRYILTEELVEGQPTSFGNKITTNEFIEQ